MNTPLPHAVETTKPSYCLSCTMAHLSLTQGRPCVYCAKVWDWPTANVAPPKYLQVKLQTDFIA